MRVRFARLLERRTEVPADCLFFDQLGARRWLGDFHLAAPSPLAVSVQAPPSEASSRLPWGGRWGPRYAGAALTGYRRLAAGVSETTFGALSVVANRSGARTYTVGRDTIAPYGFRASARDGGVVAGAFAGRFEAAPLSPGTHYLIVRRDGASVVVEQPLGADTELAVPAPPARPLQVQALDAAGAPLGSVEARLDGGHVRFRYAATRDGRRVAAYRIGVRSG